MISRTRPVREQASVVLVLQSSQACWFRWQDGSTPETFIESLTPDANQGESVCPWLSGADQSAPLRVKLVIDSPLDDVERVQSSDLRAGPVGRFQRWRLCRHLQSVYPAARLYRLHDAVKPDVLSILHQQLPAHWHDWLRRLQQRSVLFTQAVSAIELLAWVLSLHADLHSRTVLIDLPNGEHDRHLLMHCARPIVLSVMDQLGSDADQSASLRQRSVSHAQSLLRGEQQSMVVALGERSGIGGSDRSLAGAQLLASLCDGRASHLPRLDSDDEGGVSLHRSRPWQLHGFLTDSGRKTAVPRSLQLGFRHGDASQALQWSVEQLRWQRRVRLMQGASWLCAMVATSALLLASIHGVTSARNRARLQQEQQRLEEQRDKLSASVDALSPQPAFQVRQLERIDTHQRVRPVEAEQVLLRVATALQQVPAIMLDHLSWRVDEAVSLDDVSWHDPAHLPGRSAPWQAHDTPSSLRVMVSGHVQQVAGLREQQAAVEQLLHVLGQVPGIANVHILESPVSASHSSERSEADRAAYRIDLRMSAS